MGQSSICLFLHPLKFYLGSPFHTSRSCLPVITSSCRGSWDVNMHNVVQARPTRPTRRPMVVLKMMTKMRVSRLTPLSEEGTGGSRHGTFRRGQAVISLLFLSFQEVSGLTEPWKPSA